MDSITNSTPVAATTTDAPVTAPAAAIDASSPPEGDMTAAQAVAWVEAQKAAKDKGTVKKQVTKEAPLEAEQNQADKIQSEIRKHKFKVDGKEVEVDDETLKKGYGHQQTANKRFQEAKRIQEESNALMADIKNPAKLLEALQKSGGYNKSQLREIAENLLLQELEEEAMDPRDLKIRDYESREKQEKEFARVEQERAHEQKIESLKNEYADGYVRDFGAALKDVNIPSNKGTLSRMAKYIGEAAKLKFEITPAEAARMVRQDMEEEHKSLFGDADGETISRLLGDGVVNKIRQQDVSKLKNPNQFLKTPSEQGQPREISRPNQTKKMTQSEWNSFKRKK